MYRGIVKVFYEKPPTSNESQPRGFTEAIQKSPPPRGKLLEVEVVADSQASLVKKISAMLATLDGDE